jgi:maltooligosyltrehalose trehalohydrolase
MKKTSRQRLYPADMLKSRRLPIGAELMHGGVHFRVWAPRCKTLEAVIGEARCPLQSEGNGYFSGFFPDGKDGNLYSLRPDKKDRLYPDPASRFQPEGPLGPSQVVDPSLFKWSDHDWPGIKLKGQVIYEMHIGTFTKEGSWRAATREFPELARAGINVLEIMPIADFAGRFGWGYDGVDFFAPTRLYGTPDELRMFVDRAHANGLGVILDVVYNHTGPEGCFFDIFSENYFTDRYETDWGRAINFDGEGSGPVREYFVTNAGYWIEEFHMDGLRLDATQNIYDSSHPHIIAEITERVEEKAAERSAIVTAENELRLAIMGRPRDRGGMGVNGLWNDDFHHTAFVALTGHNEAYYTDYHGTPQELLSSMKRGYLYQGQYYSWQKKRRGTPTTGLPLWAFINYLENHDHIANSTWGKRLPELTSPGRHRAMTALLLLGTGTPLLFQGQEFSSASPFLFFSDIAQDLMKLVRKGRKEFLAQFRSLATPEMQALLPDPGELAAFERSKLDFSERKKNSGSYALHKDLLKIRKLDPVIRAGGEIDGAVLGESAFLIRYFAEDLMDRLLLINLGADLRLREAPEPLLAPPLGMEWRVIWSSEDPRYGGNGTAPLETLEENWRIPGEAAVLLAPEVPGK